ncbi:hypothetical protein OROMI_011520 [Orobanche minor]
MASTCISGCVDDAPVRVRSTHVNLYKWPESEFEFVRSISSKKQKDSCGPPKPMYDHPRVVDTISCRQLYLRSYTFSKEEDHRDDHKTIKCLGRRVDKENNKELRKRKFGGGSADVSGERLMRAKAAASSVFASILQGLLSCTTKVSC